MQAWLSDWENWRTVLTALTLILGYPFYRLVKRIVRLSRVALALEICQEDLRLTQDRMKRQKEHLDAYGIDSSSPSQEIRKN